MHDYRLVMISTDPRSNYNFVVYHQGINEHEVCEEVNKFYVPFGFQVDREKLTEIING